MNNIMGKIKGTIMRYFPALKGIFKQQDSALGIAPPSNVVTLASVKNDEPKPQNITTRETELVNSSVSMVANTQNNSKEKKRKKDDKPDKEGTMPEEKKHKDKHCCCDPVVIPVVIKVFDFCNEKYYLLKKFEEYIEEYKDLYPTVLFKWTKEYCDNYHRHDDDDNDQHKHRKCAVRFCVYFSLLDYEKAFEIETNLQKKYRHILLRH